MSESEKQKLYQPEAVPQTVDIEAKFAELISTELDHYAQKIAKRVLRKALGGKIAERSKC